MTKLSVYESDYILITYTPEEFCAYAEWKSDMITLPVEDFKSETRNLFLPLDRYTVKHFLINSTNAVYPFTKELRDWVFSNILKRLEKEGVEKLAIVYPIDYLTRIGIEQGLSEAIAEFSSMKVSVWEDLDDAKRWLLR